MAKEAENFLVLKVDWPMHQEEESAAAPGERSPDP